MVKTSPDASSLTGQNKNKWVEKIRTPAILFSTLLFTSAVFAQHAGQRRHNYDTNSIVTISGAVASVDSIASPTGNKYSVRLTVKNTSGTVTVLPGPSSYLDQQGVAFNTGDSVQVMGTKIHSNQNNLIIAALIVIGGKTIKLR